MGTTTTTTTTISTTSTTTTASTTTTTTTTGTQSTTTTTVVPTTTDCITIGGPGATKSCKPYTYGSQRVAYDGCINRDTPGRYVNVVPSFGNNSPAPRDDNDQDFFEEFDAREEEDEDAG